MSIVDSNQPEEDVCILWFDGLDMDRVGNCVQKKMGDCTGFEAFQEFCFHLGLEDKFNEIAKYAASWSFENHSKVPILKYYFPPENDTAKFEDPAQLYNFDI